MRKPVYFLILFVLFSCKQKTPTESDYLQRALKSDDYKVVSANFERVKDSLDIMKKRPIDTNAVIYEYNNIASNHLTPVKTISQVVNEMKKDSGLLKSAQIYIATKMAKDHRDSISKKN